MNATVIRLRTYAHAQVSVESAAIDRYYLDEKNDFTGKILTSRRLIGFWSFLDSEWCSEQPIGFNTMCVF